MFCPLQPKELFILIQVINKPSCHTGHLQPEVFSPLFFPSRAGFLFLRTKPWLSHSPMLLHKKVNSPRIELRLFSFQLCVTSESSC